MDIVTDMRRRAPYYASDFTDARKYGTRILAPALYTFFTSILPAVSFGEQLAQNTRGQLTAVHVVLSGAIGGLLQTFVGGQPLAIVGVTQPIVTILTFQFQFIEQWENISHSLFLPWLAWTGVFAAIFLVLMAVAKMCRVIYRFTRFSGEIFGSMTAVLFMQQAVVGLIGEFRQASEYARSQGPDITEAISTDKEGMAIMVNGLWALFLFAVMLMTSLAADKAHVLCSRNYILRNFLADYGVPLMVVVWTAASYSLQSGGNGRGLPSSIPRRVTTPLLWEVTDTWHTAQQMRSVPGPLIAAALVPGLIVAILFWFDHGISIKMGMPKELNLQKPAAYAYDQVVVALMCIIMPLLGCPLPNAALPQCPMHTKALAQMRTRTELDERKREQRGARASEADMADILRVPVKVHANPVAQTDLPGEATLTRGDNEGAYEIPRKEMRASLDHPGPHQRKQQSRTIKFLAHHTVTKLPAIDDTDESHDDAGEDLETPPVPAVAEQRVSNLIQSLLLAICLALMHVIRLIPTAVIWGYFAYMAIVSVEDMQFWQRLLLMFTDRRCYRRLLAEGNAECLRSVPYPVIVAFTAFQFFWTGGLWALTAWAGVGGVAFPVGVVALIPVRAYLLPLVFKAEHLEALDPSEKVECQKERGEGCCCSWST